MLYSYIINALDVFVSLAKEGAISIPIRANPPLQWKTDTRQNKTIKVSIHEEEKFTASQHDTSFLF